MRRFDREMRTMKSGDLKWLIEEATRVVRNSDERGQAQRRYTGATDATATINSWHLTDAANTLSLPKAGQGRPVLFALTQHDLRIAVEWDGAVFWSMVPVQSHATTPIAFSLPFEHLKHAAARWRRAHHDVQTAQLRLSSADQLFELSSPKGGEERLSPDVLYRITPELEQPDWSAVWAQSHAEGVAFDPEQLSTALKLLLAVSSHAGQEHARIVRQDRCSPRKRRQDFAAIWVQDGVGSVRLRSCHCEVAGPGLDGLHFGIGRKDAEALVRSLALMTVGRRSKVAVGAGWPLTRPRWTRFGGMNVITNGDVGFAFPDPEGVQPSRTVPADITPVAATSMSYAEFGKRFPHQQVLVGDMADHVQLVRREDGQALFAKTQRGKGVHRVDLQGGKAATYAENVIVGPVGQARFNLLDLTRLVAALPGADIQFEVLAGQNGQVRGFKLQQEIADLAFSAWVSRVK